MKPDKKEICLTEESILSDIQNSFTTFYPFLKIEFLQADSPYTSLKSASMHTFTPLKQLTKINRAQNINVDNERTVAEVSNDFENLLGLTIAVSRKSGKVWNVISVTESWTLESQNTAAQYISAIMTAPPELDQ